MLRTIEEQLQALADRTLAECDQLTADGTGPRRDVPTQTEPVERADLPPYESERQHPSRRRAVLLVCVAATVILVAGLVIGLGRSDGDAHDIASGAATLALYALPPADAASLRVSGSPETGVIFDYNDPNGDHVQVAVYDWARIGGPQLEPFSFDNGPVVEREMGTLGRVTMGCVVYPSTAQATPDDAFLYAAANGVGTKVTRFGIEDEPCVAGQDYDTLAGVVGDLRFVDGEQWDAYLREHTDSTPDTQTPRDSDPSVPFDPTVVTVDNATIRQWIADASDHYGVSVGDLCPPPQSGEPPSSLVMTLSVLEPVGFGSCRVVAFAPIRPGPQGELGNLPTGDYDQRGHLLNHDAPNDPSVEWAVPVLGQTTDGSNGVVGTQICITDSNGGRYCSDVARNDSAATD